MVASELLICFSVGLGLPFACFLFLFLFKILLDFFFPTRVPGTLDPPFWTPSGPQNGRPIDFCATFLTCGCAMLTRRTTVPPFFASSTAAFWVRILGQPDPQQILLHIYNKLNSTNAVCGRGGGGGGGLSLRLQGKWNAWKPQEIRRICHAVSWTEPNWTEASFKSWGQQGFRELRRVRVLCVRWRMHNWCECLRHCSGLGARNQKPFLIIESPSRARNSFLPFSTERGRKKKIANFIGCSWDFLFVCQLENEMQLEKPQFFNYKL